MRLKPTIALLVATIISTMAVTWSACAQNAELIKLAAQRFAAEGTKLGYETKVSAGEFGAIAIAFTKVGPTDENYGLLKQKWTQRETINLTYFAEGNDIKKLFLTSAKRTVEQKAPIGSWKIVIENGEIPANILAAMERTQSPQPY